MNAEDAPRNLIDLMGMLAEPPVPDPIALTPQTAGWWLLGAVGLLALAFGVGRAWLRWRANAYRRAALAALASVGDDPARIATILRRTALAAYPRPEVAGLAGSDWVAFLRATGDFPEDAAADLTDAPCRPGGDGARLAQAVERWIRTHRRAG